jgi:hypothetical protein
MRTTWARVFLVTCLLLASAGAEAAGKRIGVPKFEGAQEAAVRKKVMQALKAHGYELVRSRELQEAMSRTGAVLDSRDGLKTLAKELALSAIVTGEVSSKRAKLVVHDGGDGSSLGDASFSGANPRKLAKAVGLTFWKKLGPDVGRGHVPTNAKKPAKSSGAVSPEDDESSQGAEGEATSDNDEGEAAPPKSKEGGASSQAATAPEKKEEEPPEAGSAPFVPGGRPWLDVELGVGGLNRALTFNQNLTPGLLSYTLGLGPIAVANAVIYPLDPSFGGLLGNLGLELEIQQGFATSSTVTTNGTSVSYNNVTHDYAGGVRYRIPFSGVNDLYLSATYGEDTYAFSGRSATNVLNSPDAVYQYVRPGLGLHLAIAGRLSVALGGGYRVVTNHAGTGFQQFFPRATVAGADAELEARYALSHLLEVRAGLEWRRYWFALNAQAGDAYMASSAVDQSFAFTARLAILLGGATVPQTEGAAPEAPPPPPPQPQRRGQDKSSDE